jgi:undecaprenyl-diphosphatase
MTLLEGIVLGLVQGITEFLPVSSSGHLALFSALFKINEGNLFYSVMLHFSSLVAVLIYFREDVKELFFALFRLGGRLVKGNIKNTLSKYERVLLLLIVATIPTVIIGLAFGDFFKSLYASESIKPVGVALFFTGFLLLISEWFNRPRHDMVDVPFYKVILVGIFQGMAIVPGVSRSGSTIVGSLFIGLNKEEAARFSFLLAIPAILGATILEVFSINTAEVAINTNLLIGMVVSFVSGMFSISVLMNIIKKGKLCYFAIYVFIVAVSIILFF